MSSKDLWIKFIPRLGMVVHAYNPSYSGGESRRFTSLRPVWEKLMTPYLNNRIRGWRCGSIMRASVLKVQTLSSNPSIAKKIETEGLEV
jgi:hypothetical protein